MKTRYNYRKTFARFFKDRAGSMALTWAVAATGVIMAVGSAYDVSQVSKAKAIAQLAADNMALAASVAVDTGNQDRYVAGQIYPYTQLGGPVRDFTNSITGRVEYNVDDDGDGEGNLLARATITGTYQPAFMSILGVETIDFQATSDVAYAQREGTPASIFFAVDNSGSMGWNDSNGVRKINSLRASMKSFMDTLGAIRTYGDNIFRTALYPYNTNLRSSIVVNASWGTLTNHDIDHMYAQGGTRSTSTLQFARTKFGLENAVHENENGEENPLKFLIFMSDGANNGLTTRTVCEDVEVWVPAGSERWVLNWGGTLYTYYSWRWWFKYYNVTYYPASGGGYETQEVCTQELYSPVNEASLEQCTYMKNNGVQIYSIAYDLQLNPNDPGSNTQEKLDMALQFMKDCSSGEDVYYKFASNGADLQSVFDEIGEAVVKEVIRIKR